MGGRRVEVRAAGATRRLLVDGVLHSAWNPRVGVTGAVWDPLALAAWLRPPGSVRRALVLGVGGGSAIHLIRRHVRPERIVAVEREAVLVRAARRWFAVDGPDLDLVTADAVAWVGAQPRAARHDLVVDDLFHEAGGEPVRSAAGAPWWRSVAGLVAPDGVLVVNFAEAATARRSALLADPWFRSEFAGAVRFTCPGYTNTLVALTRAPADVAAFRRRLREAPSLDGPARRALRFRVAPIAW